MTLDEIGSAEQLLEHLKGYTCDHGPDEHVTLATDALDYLKRWGLEQRAQGARAEHARLEELRTSGADAPMTD
jgi:hypothetical protein